ncbi:MAG: glucuronate isomerase [Verrucomicrobiia bacterium]
MKKQAAITKGTLQATIRRIVETTPVYDIHTHLYDPAFGPLLLWGVDELLTYHYLVAEVTRADAIPYNDFWKLPKTQQADLVWQRLFIERTPISEACRGVVTCLNSLGFDVKKRDLAAVRKELKRWTPERFVTRVFDVARVRRAVMTNNPFDALERPVWQKSFARDERFPAALRIDEILMGWEANAPRLREFGYDVQSEINDKTASEVRRFLADWTKRMNPLYCAVSLTPEFMFPDSSTCGQLIERCIVPHCREHGIPFALMIGVSRQVNPALRLAGDGVVKPSSVEAVTNLCAKYPDNKFLVTMLSRENQHSLCVAARKFRNLHIFGCWWFLNNPVLIEEMTRMRLELLGLGVTPQHSDCRILDQLIYKWDHFRKILARVLTDKYGDLLAAGWKFTAAEIERDVKQLLGGEFERFLGR